MRSDYALYAVAVIFFIITGIVAFTLAEFERNLWTVTTAILGIFFIGLGYTQRPKPRPMAIKAPPPIPPPTVTTPAPPPPVEVVTEEKPEIVVEAAPTHPMLELTQVKGIGEKRKEQLKALNVNSVEDLAKASAEDLASKLKISPKITGKWIENAKQLLEKS